MTNRHSCRRLNYITAIIIALSLPGFISESDESSTFKILIFYAEISIYPSAIRRGCRVDMNRRIIIGQFVE